MQAWLLKAANTYNSWAAPSSLWVHTFNRKRKLFLIEFFYVNLLNNTGRLTLNIMTSEQTDIY